MVLSNPAVSGDTRAYSEYLVQVGKDLRRSIDYLGNRTDIDMERLAYYGMSWGGYLGAILPAVETRFKAMVLVAGGMAGVGIPEINDLNYVGRFTVPTLILNGRYDTQFYPETFPPGPCSSSWELQMKTKSYCSTRRTTFHPGPSS